MAGSKSGTQKINSSFKNNHKKSIDLFNIGQLGNATIQGRIDSLDNFEYQKNVCLSSEHKLNVQLTDIIFKTNGVTARFLFNMIVINLNS